MHQFCLVNKKDTESLLGNMRYSYIEEGDLLELEF